MKVFMNILKNSLLSMLFITAVSIPVKSQPTFSMLANVNPPVNSEFSINADGEPEWINCDVYNDPCSSSHNAISVIAWDEETSPGVWQVKFQITDHVTSTTLPARVISNARHPDVVFLDCDEYSGAASPGLGIIAIVYENTILNEIHFDFWDVASCMGYGTPGGPSPAHGAIKISGANPAKYPHIDALPGDPDPLLKPYYTGTPTSDYTPLNHFVITWTETVSSVDKIFVDAGHMYYLSSFPTPTIDGNRTYIHDGEMSDIAGVRVMNQQRANVGRFAHLVYKDGNDIRVTDYDVDNTTVLFDFSPETLTSIIGFPRIDGPNNMVNTNQAPPYDFRWKAVAEVIDLNGSTPVVHAYDDAYAPTKLEGEIYDPTGTTLGLYDMHVPCVAAGQGHQSYNAPFTSSTLACGFHEVQLGMLLEETGGGSYYTHASAKVDLLNSAHWGMHDINSAALNSSVNHRLAVGLSPNLGATYMSAWNNYSPGGGGQHTINWKVIDCGVTRFAYKPQPSGINIVSENTIIVNPNPTSTKINVNGIKDRAVYNIMDVTGRLVSRGNITHSDNEINVSELSQGIYILSLHENGNQQQIKLLKE